MAMTSELNNVINTRIVSTLPIFQIFFYQPRLQLVQFRFPCRCNDV